MNQTMTAVSSLIQGNIDVMSGALWPSHFNAIAQGARIRLVAGKSYAADSACVYAALVARRDLIEAGLMAGLEQLRGLRISLRRSSYRSFFMNELLSTVGMTLDDMQTVDILYTMESEALRKKTLDIAIMDEPWLTRVKESGDAAIWMPLGDLVGRFQWGFILYGPTLLDENPEAGKRFMVAYLKGVHQFRQGKTARNVEILAAYMDLDQELLGKACWPAVSTDGSIDVADVLNYQKWASKEGFLDRIIAEKEFWDPQFVEYAGYILHENKQESQIKH
jgi:NitT/TauT family transport system substrate-binding protein